MYDTLMQMGRWFGYRDGYADVCRIYMTPDGRLLVFAHCRRDRGAPKGFQIDGAREVHPKGVWLRVRSHPTSLIVTARNKMRTGRKVPMQIALEGRLAETSVLLGDEDSLEHNKTVLETVCRAVRKGEARSDGTRIRIHLEVRLPEHHRSWLFRPSKTIPNVS